MNERALAILSLLIVPSAAYAGVTAVPEPEVLELLAIAAVAGIAVALRNRRKK